MSNVHAIPASPAVKTHSKWAGFFIGAAMVVAGGTVAAGEAGSYSRAQNLAGIHASHKDGFHAHAAHIKARGEQGLPSRSLRPSKFEAAWNDRLENCKSMLDNPFSDGRSQEFRAFCRGLHGEKLQDTDTVARDYLGMFGEYYYTPAKQRLVSLLASGIKNLKASLKL